MLSATLRPLARVTRHSLHRFEIAVALGAMLVSSVPRALAQGYTFTTLAGYPGITAIVDATGSDARFAAPLGVALGPTGDVYVADNNGGKVRKVSPLGTVTTFAQIGIVQGVAVDAAGNVYTSDTQTHVVYKITPAGVATLLAGSLNVSGNGDGVGASAQFYAPRGLAVDAAGNVYVADYYNSLVRKIAPNGTVTTVAGTRGSAGSADGAALGASFLFPTGVAVDAGGNLYVTDSGNHTIRRITAAGTVSTLAGSAGQIGSADGVGDQARFNNPWGIAVNAEGVVFVGDYENSTVRQMTPARVVTTIGGRAGETGSADGPGSGARFFRPAGIAVSATGTLYVADSYNNFTLRAGYPAGVDTLPIFLAHPEQQTVTPRQRATFHVAVTGQPMPRLQWQRSNDQGTTWSNLVEDATYGGVTTSTLTVASVTPAMNGTLFRCLATNTVGPFASRPAQLVVNLAYEFTTLAGTAGATGSSDGTGAAARFDWPGGSAADTSGNVYVADTNNHTIRKITPAGATTTLAGVAGQPGALDGTGIAARFNNPTSLVVDPTGNVFVADGSNHSIRRITPAGTVTTIAGGLSADLFGHVDAKGSAARFYYPTGIALDRLGNLYVVDWSQHTIRRIDPEGNVTTIAGQRFSHDTSGHGSNVDLVSPEAVAVDYALNVYVADGLGEIVKLLPNGRKEVIAGRNGSGGAIDGPGSVARFTFLNGLAVDRAGNLFATDGDDRIRWISPAGVVTTIGGSDTTTLDNRTSVDGVGTLSRFNRPAKLTVDANGTLYIPDRGNSTVRVGRFAGNAVAPTIVTEPASVTTPVGHDVTFRVGFTAVPLPVCQWQRSSNGGASWADLVDDATFIGTTLGYLTIRQPSLALDGTEFRCLVTNTQGSVVSTAATLIVQPAVGNTTLTTFAGVPGFFGSNDGPADTARFREPEGIAVAPNGTIYVADTNHTIRKITPAGVVSTFAGAVGEPGSSNGTGSSARFLRPHGLATDSAGNVYVAEYENHTIRKITPAGVVTTLAGQAGEFGSTDGTGTAARFNLPSDVTVDSSGNVFVVDSGNHSIRKITPAGAVTTLAGSSTQPGYVDGTGTSARFRNPSALAVGPSGDLYVADSSNQVIRKVTSTGAVTTVTGRPASGGPVGAVILTRPDSIALDAEGNMFVGESTTHLIHRISAEGNLTTILGQRYVGGANDGVGNAARLDQPSALALDAAGNLLIADRTNHTIRLATRYAVPTLSPTRTHAAPNTGGSATFSAGASGEGTLSYTWSRNGAAVNGGTASTLTLADVQPSRTGLYRVAVANAAGASVSWSNILGLLTSSKVIGDGEEFQANILHPSGRTFDQLLLTGAAASFTADAGQVTRLSFVDLNNDIVQVEFSGPGTVSLVLDGSSGPNRPINYVQAVDYMKGHAGIVVAGATEQSHLSIFTVGRANAYNQALFRDDVAYDGVADMAFVAILSADGKFGGLRTANVNFWAAQGVTGVYAPGVQFTGPVFVGDINAFDNAEAFLVIGGGADTRITGGDLFQSNARPVQVHGLTQLKFTSGTTSHGVVLAAQPNNSHLVDAGADVTVSVVVNPAP